MAGMTRLYNSVGPAKAGVQAAAVGGKWSSAAIVQRPIFLFPGRQLSAAKAALAAKTHFSHNAAMR
jgi:hypothetical protein